MSDPAGLDEKNININSDETDEQQFIQEKIISKRKKRWLRRLVTFLFVIFCAFVFGVLARFFFIVSGDALVEILGIQIPVTRDPVSIYKEKTPTPTPRPSVTPIVKNATFTPRPTPTAKPSATNTPTVAAKTTPEPTAVPTALPSPTKDPEITPLPETTGEPEVTAGAEVTPTPEGGDAPSIVVGDASGTPTPNAAYSYVRFMEEVMEVEETVAGSIVSVDGITTGISFLGERFEVRTGTTGILLAQDGVDVLILTDYTSVEEASSVEVTFYNDERIYSGEIYNFDKDLDLAVIGVPIASLDDGTFENIQYAVSCKTEDISLGVPVFEIGRATGYPNLLSFGIINSVGNGSRVKDAEISYFTTDDWHNYSGSSGFVFNMDGCVMGMLGQKLKTSGEQNGLPCFVSLCALEDEINILLNGGKLVNFGIYASTLSKVIKDSGLVDSGIYLEQVAAASPAYAAGLRVGDVITAINGARIYNMAEFMDVLSGASATEALNITYMRNSVGGSKEFSAYVILTSK